MPGRPKKQRKVALDLSWKIHELREQVETAAPVWVTKPEMRERARTDPDTDPRAIVWDALLTFLEKADYAGLDLVDVYDTRAESANTTPYETPISANG